VHTLEKNPTKRTFEKGQKTNSGAMWSNLGFMWARRKKY